MTFDGTTFSLLKVKFCKLKQKWLHDCESILPTVPRHLFALSTKSRKSPTGSVNVFVVGFLKLSHVLYSPIPIALDLKRNDVSFI